MNKKNRDKSFLRVTKKYNLETDTGLSVDEKFKDFHERVTDKISEEIKELEKEQREAYAASRSKVIG